MARYLRQTGFDINETLKILNAPDKSTTLNSYKELLQNLQLKKRHLEIIMKVLNHNLELLTKAKIEQPQFELIVSPAFNRLFYVKWINHIKVMKSKLKSLNSGICFYPFQMHLCDTKR